MLKHILVIFLLSLISVTLTNSLLKNSHYCCEVDTHKETFETRTRTVSKAEIYTSSQIHNYTYCPPTDHIGIIEHIASQLANKTDSDGNLVTKPLPTIKPCISKPMYQIVTNQKITYRIETYQVPVVSVQCLEEHIICCKGFIMFNKQCIAEEDWEKLKPFLAIIG